MQFRYDGQVYKTKIDASTIYNDNYYIQLPDKRYLQVAEWLESDPPKPRVMDEVSGDEIDPLALIATAEIVRNQ